MPSLGELKSMIPDLLSDHLEDIQYLAHALETPISAESFVS